MSTTQTSSNETRTKRRAEASEGSAATALKEQGRVVAEDVAELGSITKDAAKETLDDAKRATGKFAGRVGEKASELEGATASYIQERPMKAALIAAGAGVLVGLLLSRRRNS